MTKTKLRPDQVRGRGLESQLKCKYGMSEASYEALLVSQGGRCKICRSDRPEGGRWWRFVVDHDHQTGKVRGLLCPRCNRMLGFAKDDCTILTQAVLYLLESRK